MLGIDNDLTFARDKNDPAEIAFRQVETLIVRLKSIQEKLTAKDDRGVRHSQLRRRRGRREAVDRPEGPENEKGAYFARERKWQQGAMKEDGRLLSPAEAMNFKEDRLWELVQKANAASAVEPLASNPPRHRGAV